MVGSKKNSNNQFLAKSGAKGRRRQNRAKENQPKRQRRGISGQWRERERKVQLDAEEISLFRPSKRIVGYVGTDDPCDIWQTSAAAWFAVGFWLFLATEEQLH